MPPSVTGTLLADAHDLPVLANTTVGNMPFDAFYIDGVAVGVPVVDITPAPEERWIRGTRWEPMRGTAWAPVGGTRWPWLVK